jgi:epoxyqueuosine reductase
MGVRVFGCGVCEEVCPKNRNAKQGRYEDWKACAEIPERSLGNLLEDCENGFEGRFKETPIHRLGKQRLLRNLLVAMGNSATNDYISYAKKFAGDARLKPYALRALEKLQTGRLE